MPLLSFDGVSAEYGATTVFSDLTFSLQPGQRLGVVGPNGAGKSTMLKLVSGELEPAAGKITRERRARIGMLDQFDAALTTNTVLEQTISARTDLLDLRHRLHDLEQRLAAGEHGADVLAEYGAVQERYEHGGGYTLEARAREVLGGLGFLDEALDHPCSELSGGQGRRVQLAQLLLLETEIFLLDEPTNHLDLGSIEWLEDYLKASSQAMLIVSHDRRLLDDVADSILELEAGRGYTYPGSYSKFVRLRAERRREQLRQYQAQQEYIAHQEAFIQRYKAGQRAREARGRQTRLERLERVAPPTTDKEIRIRFGGPTAAAVALRGKGLVAGYAGRGDEAATPLVETPAFEVESGGRVAIIGPNGSGKTTLLRTLQGSLEPLKGSVGYGSRVRSSYYDQHLGDLPEDQTLVEVLQAAQPLSEESARNHLARLLFRGDDVFKRVRQLSGGERSRLALARLMLDQGNLLFLDEPTNHLDLPSQEVLQEALMDFPGTIVFVSHDRELIDGIATTSWWLEPAEGPGAAVLSRVKIEQGGYRQHKSGGVAPVQVRATRQAGTLAPGSARPATSSAAPSLGKAPGASRAAAAVERKARAAAARHVADLEARIEAGEARLREIQARLGDPELYRYPIEAEILGREHKDLTERMTSLYREWESAAGRVPEPAAGAPAGAAGSAD
jgi:ATP-binding cassette, subfamily F, member 3